MGDSLGQNSMAKLFAKTASSFIHFLFLKITIARTLQIGIAFSTCFIKRLLMDRAAYYRMGFIRRLDRSAACSSFS